MIFKSGKIVESGIKYHNPNPKQIRLYDIRSIFRYSQQSKKVNENMNALSVSGIILIRYAQHCKI
jgi:DNA invertase Pin-like site-specific DNA recombinase